MPLLTCEGLVKRYGGVTAVAEVSLALMQGESVGVIGSNGAGKTTLFALLTGFEHPDEGKIILTPHHGSGGQTIAVHTAPAYRLARAGVGRTFQNLRLFEGLTVRENIQTVVYSLKIANCPVDALLDSLGLRGQADTVVSALPYGTRKLCELARAAAVASSGCGLLFLDEPCAGLCEEETGRLAVLLGELKERYRLTLFLIEHHMAFVERVCGRLYAMDTGRIIAAGTPREVFLNTAVKRAILGVG